MNTKKLWPLFLASFPQISAKQTYVGTVCVGLPSVVYKDIHGLTKSGEMSKLKIAQRAMEDRAIVYKKNGPLRISLEKWDT